MHTVYRFWENQFIDNLLTDRTARNLLYVEVCMVAVPDALHHDCPFAAKAIASLDNGSIDISPQIRQSLSTLQSKGSKKEVSFLCLLLKSLLSYILFFTTVFGIDTYCTKVWVCSD